MPLSGSFIFLYNLVSFIVFVKERYSLNLISINSGINSAICHGLQQILR